MSGERREDAGRVNLQPFAVALIDVLGQREMLLQAGRSLWDANSPRCLSRDEKRPFESVHKARRWMKIHYEGFQGMLDRSSDSSVKANERFVLQQFSDTLLFYSPLVNDSNEVLLPHVYVILVTCGHVMLRSLADGIPLRGAVEVSYAIELGDRDIYGPVVAAVDRLEKHVAQWPRIVVGDNLMIQLHGRSSASDHASRDEREATDAKECLSLIDVAVDGIPFVDFLGEKMRELTRGSGEEEKLQAFVKQGAQFALQKYGEYFENAHNNRECQKLALRYALLKDYYVSRLPLWGIDPKDLDIPDLGDSP